MRVRHERSRTYQHFKKFNHKRSLHGMQTLKFKQWVQVVDLYYKNMCDQKAVI